MDLGVWAVLIESQLSVEDDAEMFHEEDKEEETCNKHRVTSWPVTNPLHTNEKCLLGKAY